MPTPARTLMAVTAALAVVAARGAPAQEAVFRAGVDLVHLTVTVTDADGRFVTDLQRDDFIVSDDGVPQEILSFGSERVPVSLGLLLDVSGSMTQARMAQARAAIDRFAFDLLDPEDELLLAEFSGQARLLQTWTRDRTEFRIALARANRGAPGFGSAVVDAVGATLVAVTTGAHDRKALVLISDGRDNASRVPVRDVQEQIRRSEVIVYALGMDDRSAPGGGADARALRRLTDETGGRTEVVHGYENLDAATARLAEEFNQQYSMAYASPARGDGRWHEIRVDVQRRGLTVRARSGYVAF